MAIDTTMVEEPHQHDAVTPTQLLRRLQSRRLSECHRCDHVRGTRLEHIQSNSKRGTMTDSRLVTLLLVAIILFQLGLLYLRERKSSIGS